jgi:hypothetical protein
MSVDEFVSDFEKGIWRGIEEVFPNTDMIGCAFHWTQAINRVNKRAGKRGVNFYELIPLLFKESQLIEVQISYCLKPQPYNARQIRSSLQGKLLGIWDLYVNKQIRTYDLLKLCFKLYAEQNKRNKLHYLSG